MTVLSRGANAALGAGRVEIAVAGARQGSVDLLVFQLGPDRKVRSDADLIFFNQPSSPEGAVRLVAADRITADLTAVPAGVEMLAIAVALDDAAPGSLAAIPGLAVTVSSGTTDSAESHSAPASGLSVERAAVLVEIYRRAGAWKVRNVSAGWAAGLSALAGEHGVSIDDQPSVSLPPDQALPPAVLPQPAYPQPAQASSAPARSVTAPPAVGTRPGTTGQVPYPTPGGFPPPGGSLPPPPPFRPPTPGGWPAPGGFLAGRPA